MMRLKFRRVPLLRAVVAALLVVAPLGCVSGCGEDSVAGPYCGLIAEEDVTPIVGRVTEVEEGSDGVFYCSIEGERAVLAAHGTADSWVAFGRGGNNAFTTLEAIAGGEGREVPGTDARVFSYVFGSGTESANAYAYWLEGRAGFAMYTVIAEDADESTAAALEELVIKYAPQVLDGVASRTEDPGRNRHDPATGTPSPEPSAAQTADSSSEAESTSTGSPGS